MPTPRERIIQVEAHNKDLEALIPTTPQGPKLERRLRSLEENKKHLVWLNEWLPGGIDPETLSEEQREYVERYGIHIKRHYPEEAQ